MCDTLHALKLKYRLIWLVFIASTWWFLFDIILCYCFFISPATVHHCVQPNRIHVHVGKLARFNANQFDIHVFLFWSIQLNVNIKLNYRHKHEASQIFTSWNVFVDFMLILNQMACRMRFQKHQQSLGWCFLFVWSSSSTTFGLILYFADLTC